MRGTGPLIAYAALTAGLDVYGGNRLQVLSPQSLAAISFSVTAAFFLGVEAVSRGIGATLRPIRTHRLDIVAINVTTAVTWLSTFYALKYLEPAVVNVVGLALVPAFTVLLGPLLRRGGAALAVEVAVALGICGLLGTLVWGSFRGLSGIGTVDPRQVVAGLTFAVICAIGSTANIIYMKRLSEAGHGPRAVLAIRFFLMIGVAWVATLMTDRANLADTVAPALIVAVIGVGLPIYVLQIGIKYTEPITTSLLVSMSPLFAIGLQLADGRLRPSFLTITAIIGIIALAAVGTIARGRATAAVTAGRDATPTGDSLTGNDHMICAIVDAYGAGQLLPGALRRYGVDYVHVRSEYPDSRLTYRSKDFTVDLAHSGDIAQTAAKLRDLGVSAVVAAAESGVLLADELSAALGTPGNGMRRPSVRRDKFAMQEAVRDAGLAAAECFVSDRAEEIVAWARARCGWPIVCKPVSSAGTDNVLICRSAADVATAHARIMTAIDRYGRRNESVFAQRFLCGAEYYVNAVSRAGVHRIVEIWRYYKRAIADHSVYDYENLLCPDDPGARVIADYTLAVLDALEVHNGASHTEVMLTGDGPYLIECGARLGGGQMPEVLTRCIGTDQVDRLAFSIARPDEFVSEAREPYRPVTHLRCVNLISLSDGTVPSADRWGPVRALGSFAGMVLNQPEGSPVTRTVDMATCPGTLYLSSDDAGQVEADYVRVRELEKIGLYG